VDLGALRWERVATDFARDFSTSKVAGCPRGLK